jgi:hypothetical protein
MKAWMVGTSPTMTDKAVFMDAALFAARSPGKTACFSSQKLAMTVGRPHIERKTGNNIYG